MYSVILVTCFLLHIIPLPSAESTSVLKVPLPSADELNNILLDATNCFDSDNDIDDNIVQNNQMDTYFSVQQANASLNSKYSNEDSFSTIRVNVRSLINPTISANLKV